MRIRFRRADRGPADRCEREYAQPLRSGVITARVNGGDQDFRIGGGQAGRLLESCWTARPAPRNRAGSTLWAAVNAPSLDAITEFAVETNGFKAEFGRAGGGLVTFVSKGGGNQYHGNVFDFIRNDAFDARGFFNYRRRFTASMISAPRSADPCEFPSCTTARNVLLLLLRGIPQSRGRRHQRRRLTPGRVLPGRFPQRRQPHAKSGRQLPALQDLRSGLHAL